MQASSCGGGACARGVPEQAGGARRDPAATQQRGLWPPPRAEPALGCLALALGSLAPPRGTPGVGAMCGPAARRRYQADPKDADVERCALQVLLCVRRRRGWGCAAPPTAARGERARQARPQTHLLRLEPPMLRAIILHLAPPAQPHHQSARYVLDRPEVEGKQEHTHDEHVHKAAREPIAEHVGYDGQGLRAPSQALCVHGRAVWVRACGAWHTLKSKWKSAGTGCCKPLASSEALPIRPACSSGSAPKPKPALLNEAI